ncbi:unnamed protein product [Effrenium voratum]|nr:unnamed protein product [Effrenium voratum]
MDEVVCLNVGGELYSVARSTLMKQPSLIAQMLAGDAEAVWWEDCLCIDRDGRLFRHVLNYLRDGWLPLGLCRPDRIQLLQEARFFGLEELHLSLGGLQEPQLRPHRLGGEGQAAEHLTREVRTTRQFVRLRYGHEYSGGWLVSSPRHLPNVDYELHGACLARSALEAMNKLAKAGFRPCDQPPKMPKVADSSWELMMYKDIPVPLTYKAEPRPARPAPKPRPKSVRL